MQREKRADQKEKRKKTLLLSWPSNSKLRGDTTRNSGEAAVCVCVCVCVCVGGGYAMYKHTYMYVCTYIQKA